MKHSSQWNLTRESVLGSGLSPETPGLDLQRACGTGLEAAILLANKIALGQIDCAIAARRRYGERSARGLPQEVPAADAQELPRRSAVQRLSPWLALRLGHFRPVLPGIAEPRTGLSMGESTELMVKTLGHHPRGAGPVLALQSHQKAAAAYAEGFYADLVQGYLGLTQDNNIRNDTSLEKLAKLKPVFDRSGAGTLTAGNSTPMTDGASAVLLATETWARERQPAGARLPRLRQGRGGGLRRQEGLLLMAPAYAVPRMLSDAGLGLEDFDFYEIHEAFAGQVLCTLKAWSDPEFCRNQLGAADALGSVDRAKLNVKGGSLAIGHPFAATGTRILATLAKTLDQNRARRGLISICTAGGMGVTAIVER